MATRIEVVEALKSSLKRSGMTYADIAKKLCLSEVTIKRNFALRNFTLDRLEAICECVGMDFSELVQLADDQQAKISHLTLEQEQELVDDLKFLLVGICVQNAWQMGEIVAYYKISEAECIKYLIRLERHGLIRLLPNNKIRRMVTYDFKWLPQGPIETFFEKSVQNEYMNSHFTGKGEMRIYKMGMLSKKSMRSIHDKLEMITREFSSLQYSDEKLPAKDRRNVGLMLTFRPWELNAFSVLTRNNID